MGKKNPIKSMKTTNKTAILIVVFFMLITFIIFQCTYTASYASLEQAVKRSSYGGQIKASYDFDKGTFVLIKDSITKKYDYYYLRNKKWYNQGFVSKKNYSIEGKYKVTVYYVKKNKISFIQVESKEELSNLNDSMNTLFTEIYLNDKETCFIGGTYKNIPDDYKIIINDKEYWLKEYNTLFKLFQ